MISQFQPYVGPRPFEPKEQNIFYGRDREASDLLSLIIAHNAVLFYAPSGAGKTSLLNTKIFSQLSGKGFDVLPMARVGGSIPISIKSEEIPNIYVFNSLASWVEEAADVRKLLPKSIVEFLSTRKHSTNREKSGKPSVIIFDQFEEIFSSYQDRWRDRKGFFTQIAEALNDDLVLRIVFVIREDYIAQLDSFIPLFSDKLRTRFRLDRLSEKSALAAVTGPLKGTGRNFADGVAEKLVEELLKVRIETDTSGVVEVTGPFVEPVQLQIVCESLWRDLPFDVSIITKDHLKTFGDVDEALSGFYERSIKKVVNETDTKEGKLRRWFEQTLITSAGTRAMVFRGQQEVDGIPITAMDLIEDLHLIRGEWRGGARWYELTHDRFIQPILKSNQKWRDAHKETEQTRTFLEAKSAEWVRLGRRDENLLDENRLLEAEHWMVKPDAIESGYSESVIALIQASRAAFERRQAREKAAVAIRRGRLAMAFIVLFALALAASIYAIIQQRQAQANAQQAKIQAVRADRLAKEAVAARDTAVFASKRADSLRIVADSARFQAETERQWSDTLRARAVAAQELAEKRGVKAEEAKKQAQLAAEKESKARAQVDSLSQGYMARALAAQAIRQYQLNQFERGALLARQAYLFHQRSAGEFLDDVYEALRKTLNAFGGYGGPQVLSDHTDWVTSVAFERNGKILASGSADSTVILWNLKAAGPECFRILRQNTGVKTIAISSDGKLLAVGGEDFTIRLWNLQQPDAVFQLLKGHTGQVWCLQFSPDGKMLASGSADSTVRLWNLQKDFTTFKVLPKQRDKVRSIVFNPNGHVLVLSSGNNIIQLWDLRYLSFTSISSPQNAQIRCLAFSLDGKFLASGSNDGRVFLWDMNKLSIEPKIFVGHNDRVNTVALSPDSKMLATGSADKSIRLCNLDNPKLGTIVLLGHESWIWSIAFSPEDGMLASGSSDCTIRIWNTSIDALASVVCNHVHTNLTAEEWHEFVGTQIPYERTCTMLPIDKDVPADSSNKKRIFEQIKEVRHDYQK